VYKLYKPYSSGIRSSFFCERLINVWNSLPADVDFSSAYIRGKSKSKSRSETTLLSVLKKKLYNY